MLLRMLAYLRDDSINEAVDDDVRDNWLAWLRLGLKRRPDGKPVLQHEYIGQLFFR